MLTKNMKKSLCCFMAVLTATTMLTACGTKNVTEVPGSNSVGTEEKNEGTKSFKPMKIAYAVNQVDEAFLAYQKAMVDVIGPALNIEFTFSEQLKDAGDMTTFIENAYAAGCDAVVCNLASSVDQAAAVCNDLGIKFVGISSSPAAINQDMPSYISVVGASAQGYGASYGEAIKSVTSDGKEHSVLILSGAACYGATSFIEGTAGALKALQDVYGLTYEKDLMELATTSTQIDAANDKNIKITIFPGMEDLAGTVSPILQTGEYDVLCGTTNIYDQLGVAVDEVEKDRNMDIKFITRSAMSDSIAAAFNGTDSQGSPIIDAIVSPGTFEHVAAVTMLRNAFDGYDEQMRDNGNASNVTGMDPLVITSAEDYNVLAKKDMPYSFVTVDDILAMCNTVNNEVTYQTINDFGASINTQSILERFNK